MKAKKIAAMLLAAVTAMSSMTLGVQAAETEAAAEAAGVPKYVFLFIGDGMSYPQIQLTNYFLSANANADSA